MSTEALVPAGPPQPNALVQFDGGISGGIEDAPLTIENITLIQNGSRVTNKKPGQFRLDSGEYVETIFAIPLGKKTKRVLFPDGELGAKPLCRSNDGIVPAPGVLDKKSNTCKDCKFASWAAYSAAKKRGASIAQLKPLKPKCQQKAEFVYVDKLTMQPTRLNVGGTSLREINDATKDIQSKIQSKINLARFEMGKAKARGEEYVPPTIGLYDFTIQIKSREIQNSQGSFYVMEFTVVPTVFDSEDERKIFGEIYKEISAKLIAQQQRSDDSMETEAVEESIDESMPGAMAATAEATFTTDSPVISEV